MSVAVWPEELPQHVRGEGYGEAPAMRFASFPNDTGPDIERPKGTLPMDDSSFTFIMTNDQVDTFRAFVTDDLAHGVLPFLMDHPRRGDEVRVRMTGQPRYTIRPFTALEWLVSFRCMVIG